MKAVTSLNGTDYNGNQISVIPDQIESKDSMLVVKNIPYDVTEENFVEVFSEADDIAQIQITPMKYNDKYNIAHIIIEDTSRVETCIEMFHGSQVFSQKPLEVSRRSDQFQNNSNSEFTIRFYDYEKQLVNEALRIYFNEDKENWDF